MEVGPPFLVPAENGAIDVHAVPVIDGLLLLFLELLLLHLV